MTKSEFTKQMKQQAGVGVTKFEFSQFVTWAGDHSDEKVRGFAWAMRWGMRTQRFSFEVEQAMRTMTPAKMVEFMVNTVWDCPNNQQAMVNRVNTMFRKF